ncbi:MarR family winged helix-turn-helix transcriptional regulator [Actinophytocola oryzae]|uniref:DNA-binding MarR family transcriptional regulator n=1 Tax=Actinophytocola oryzae TaxID=502181 RepID=A0A4R7W6U9_9PSEU|nr:MarR family winged helix-turn-helix transcriptional regulator [Actinophytocola oryzae]TDV57427.1 DNA-binding MarR family transcriptional regulator [Actinophytocola oryzae]
MAENLSLPALLSRALVAFTIELDDELEHRMPHRTAAGPQARSGRGPWLTSLAMWANFLRYLTGGGAPLRELEYRAGLVNLAGLERWGYVTVAPADTSVKSRKDFTVELTRAGRRACEAWEPLPELVETSWRERFGEAQIDALLTSLRAVAADLEELEWPYCLPVIPFADGMRSPVPRAGRPDADTLPALLSRVLLAFTLEYERESELSLPISANVLRVLDEKGVRVRDLPGLTGVSKEAVNATLTFVTNRQYVVVEPPPDGGRFKLARLTTKGRTAQTNYHTLIESISERWEKEFDLTPLRNALTALPEEILRAGVGRHPEGWRAQRGAPSTLPHHPMVLHRGGYPDGS